MDRLAQRKQANEIATRLDQGATVNELAQEYGLHRQTIWRRAQQGIAARYPGMDDRDEARELMSGILWQRIEANFETGDDKALAVNLDRYAKMNGIDHTHRVQEAQLHLDAKRVQLMADRMDAAFDVAGIPVKQRQAVLEALTDDQ